MTVYVSLNHSGKKTGMSCDSNLLSNSLYLRSHFDYICDQPVYTIVLLCIAIVVKDIVFLKEGKKVNYMTE